MLALSLRLLGRALFGKPLSPSLAEHALKALDRIMAQTRSPLALLDLAAEARFRKDRGPSTARRRPSSSTRPSPTFPESAP